MKRFIAPISIGLPLAFGVLSVPAESATVAWWRFEDGESATLANSGSGGSDYDAAKVWTAQIAPNAPNSYINDGAGNYYANTSSYAPMTSGVGSALSQAATSDLARVFAGSFTLEAFVYSNEVALPFAGVFGNDSESSPFLFGTGGGSLLRFFGVENDSGGYRQAFGPVIEANQWVHIALVGVWYPEYNELTIKLFVNGVQVAAEPAIGGLKMDLTSTFSIGGANPFPGYIDEIRLSDTALTPDQFLSMTSIPEPSSVLLAIGGLLFAVARNVRKKLA